MMVPVVLALSRKMQMKPSKLLLPLSYFAILGGTCTLIGTSTNLLVNEVYRAHGGPGFGILEFAPMGVCYFLIGFLYIFATYRKLLPEVAPLTALLPEDRGATFVTELVVRPEAALVGKILRDIFPQGEKTRLLEIVRGEQVIFAGAALDLPVEPEDALIVEGTPEGIAEFIQKHGLRVATVVEDEKRVEMRSMDLAIAEAVVLPDSPYVGRNVGGLGLNRLYGVKVMAIQRHGRQHRYHIRGMRLHGGDVLLLQADRRGLGALKESGSVMIVEGVDKLILEKDKAPLALGIFILVVLLAALNIAPLTVLAVAGAGLLMATQCLRPRDAMTALDPAVLLLIIGSIPLGIAMEKTGLAARLVHVTLDALGSLGPVAVLSGLYFITSLLSSFLSNNATAVLLAPIALGIAAQLGADPRPFLLAVAFGASASFATPIGYQTNMIVMGPGGYTTKDFVRFGLPLNVMLWIAAAFLIPLFWPLF
jgi:di/tricarboxylate transporter